MPTETQKKTTSVRRKIKRLFSSFPSHKTLVERTAWVHLVEGPLHVEANSRRVEGKVNRQQRKKADTVNFLKEKIKTHVP